MKGYLFLLLLILIISYSFAEIITARSGSRSDIQSAIDKAQSGDVVRIPAGTFSFDGAISFKAGITIVGAGQKRTILKRTGSNTRYMFTIDGSNGKKVRMSDFSIVGRSPKTDPGIKLVGGCKDFRINRISFTLCYPRAVEIHGDSRGVIDHCSFIDVSSTAVVIYGDTENWDKPLRLGTADAVFVEDCYFSQNRVTDKKRCHHIASNNGSRYVFRYNTIDDGKLESHSIDAHGNKFYWPRGSRSYEIYHNVIKAGHRWVGINVRGGDGVIFGNRFEGSYVNTIHLMHEGKDGDGNCGYPCKDQIRELHIWDNTYEGRECSIKNRHPNIVKLNRDYYLSKRSDYEPYTYPHPLAQEATHSTHSRSSSVNFVANDLVTAPNPFTSFTSIRYTIANKVVPVRLSVFNAQGKLVHTLVDTRKAPGSYEVRWNGRDENGLSLANGIYTIQMVTPDSKISRSVVYTRK